jgi:Xaa-Pro aminopeptidase
MSVTAAVDVARLSAALRESGLDVLVAASPENVLYTSGVTLVTQRLIPERLAFVIWRPSGAATALVEALEQEVTRRRGAIADVRTYGEHTDGPVVAIAALLREWGMHESRIGIEARFITHDVANRLAAALPRAILVPADAIFDRVRLLKSPPEMERLEAAARLLEDAVSTTATIARPGMSERSLGMHMLSQLMARSEARLSGAAATVASGPNAHVTHHGSAERRLEDGDLVRLGCRGIYDGYHGIVMRTGTVGRPRAELQRVYRDLYDIHSAVIEMLRPGVAAGAVYREAQRHYGKRGYALPLPHVGHSIGLALQERPKFHPGAEDMLVAGMACVVVNVIASEHGRFYLEDMVVIGESGARELSNASHAADLLEIGTDQEAS